MDLFLVRHGEAAASWGESTDPGLSELGREQAVAAAQILQPQASADTRLVSSPLARAQETCTPLAQALQRDVAIDDVFCEVPSPVPLEQRQDWLRGFMQQEWAEQEESLLAWRDSAYARLLSFDAPTVVFTHFLVINAVVGVIEDYPATLRFWPDNGSITHLRHTGERLELVALGAEIETRVN
ncbi:MAG: broad specificity phosphatase PhoE [Bacteroidia bacterium]|jgi:broad specificity phosphatase PhoE